MIYRRQIKEKPATLQGLVAPKTGARAGGALLICLDAYLHVLHPFALGRSILRRAGAK
jgi:hypothetical protein